MPASDGLLTGTTDARLQVLDGRVLDLEVAALADGFGVEEIIEAFVRRIGVMRAYDLG